MYVPPVLVAVFKNINDVVNIIFWMFRIGGSWDWVWRLTYRVNSDLIPCSFTEFVLHGISILHVLKNIKTFLPKLALW